MGSCRSLAYIKQLKKEKMTKFKLNLNINSFKRNLMQHLATRMNEVVIKLVGYVKSNFGPSNQGGTNPSRPGDAPNIGTGTLRNSIGFKVRREGSEVIGSYGTIKGPADAYARRLELGFVGKDSLGRNYNQQARPFLRPAYKKNKRKIIKILSK